jgi:sec-independent protein translocase protein TatC
MKNDKDHSNDNMSFWDHIEVLRWLIVRCFIFVIVIFVFAFLNREFVFDNLILTPRNSDFISYKLLCNLSKILSYPSLCPDIENIPIINVTLGSQFITHMSISFYLGLIIAFPYIMFELWIFARPAFLVHEKKYAIIALLSFLILFYIGTLMAFYVIFPLTINFLGTYQVSKTIPNYISLDSYIDSFLTTIFMMGLLFELPIIGYFFSKIGLLKASFLKKYRKIALLIILILAAILTPSTDAFTMILVSLPLFFLYEVTIWVVKKTEISF